MNGFGADIGESVIVYWLLFHHRSKKRHAYAWRFFFGMGFAIMDVAPFGAERNVLMLVENYIGEKELDQCKAGFTWKYVVKEKSTNGGRQTVITGETVYKSASGITFGMPYPFDSGRREDKTVDAIREAMLNLRAFACEVNVPVQEYGSQTIIGQGLGGKVVQDFIADLARINRVLVVMDETVTK